MYVFIYAKIDIGFDPTRAAMRNNTRGRLKQRLYLKESRFG